MSPLDRRQFLGLGSGLVLGEISTIRSVTPTTLASEFDLVTEDTVTFGADATYPPHSYVEPGTESVVGLDVDLANEIARRMGLEARFVTIEWSGIIPALQAKRFDAISAQMNITPERAEVVDFSDPVITSGHVVVVPSSNSDIDGIDDLVDRTILVPLGTTEEQEARNHTSHVRTYPTLAECFRQLDLGRGDAIIVDLAVASFYIKQSYDRFKVVTEPLNATFSAFAFRKDPASASLRSAVNKTMAAMREDGAFEEILSRWIVTPFSQQETSTPHS